MLLTSLVFIKFIKLNHKYDDPPSLASSKFNDPPLWEGSKSSDPPPLYLLTSPKREYIDHNETNLDTNDFLFSVNEQQKVYYKSLVKKSEKVHKISVLEV